MMKFPVTLSQVKQHLGAGRAVMQDGELVDVNTITRNTFLNDQRGHGFAPPAQSLPIPTRRLGVNPSPRQTSAIPALPFIDITFGIDWESFPGVLTPGEFSWTEILGPTHLVWYSALCIDISPISFPLFSFFAEQGILEDEPRAFRKHTEEDFSFDENLILKAEWSESQTYRTFLRYVSQDFGIPLLFRKSGDRWGRYYTHAWETTGQPGYPCTIQQLLEKIAWDSCETIISISPFFGNMSDVQLAYEAYTDEESHCKVSKFTLTGTTYFLYLGIYGQTIYSYNIPFTLTVAVSHVRDITYRICQVYDNAGFTNDDYLNGPFTLQDIDPLRLVIQTKR
jgi:hypothetical protein